MQELRVIEEASTHPEGTPMKKWCKPKKQKRGAALLALRLSPIQALAAPSPGSPRAARSASRRFPIWVISSYRNVARGNARSR